MALTENEKKFGPLIKKPKKKLTMKERQPIRFGKGIFDGPSNQPDRMFRKQRKKSAVSGTMKGAPINTTGAPKYTTVNKPKTAANIKKATIYKSNSMTKSPYGDADLAGKGRKGKNSNAVPVSNLTIKDKAPVPKHLVSKNTPSSINRMDKKKPENKKKRYRAKVTMTSMKNKYF